MTPAKIITVAHLIPWVPQGGGAESLLLDICRSIDTSRFRVVVFYWAEADELAAPMRDAGAVVVRLPLGKVFAPSSVFCLKRALREYRVDILHTHFMDSDLMGFWAALFTGIPMVMHVHSFPFPATARHALRYKLMAPWISRIICVSGFVKEWVMQKTGIAAAKFSVVPNGADGDRFACGTDVLLKRSLGLTDGLPVIGTVARLENDKSVETLLQAAVILRAKYPLAKFLIVGDGTCRASLEALTVRLGLEDVVVFAGRRRDIPQLLALMDVFVMTAVEEAFGLSLLEALAAGRSVVVANACALPELVRDGEEGLLYWPRNERALAEAVMMLLDDPALARRLAAAGLGRSQMFTSRAMTRLLEDLYVEVLA